MKTCVFTPSHETGILMTTSSCTPAVMTLAWGAKARDRRCYRGPIFFRPLMVKGSFCALTGRAAFLFRGNVGAVYVSRERYF